MAVVRSTGALVGTDESTGVALAAAGSLSNNTLDLLADATSYGNVSLYLCFTPASAPASGSIAVKIEEGRTSAAAALYTDPRKQPDELPGNGLDNTQRKVHLGKFAAPRYLKVTVMNKTDVAFAGVAVLYELEKLS